jgi:hypothetical protein
MKIVLLSVLIVTTLFLRQTVAQSPDDPKQAIIFVSCEFVFSDGERELASTGTGFLVTRFGHLVSAKHVLAPQTPGENVKTECVGARISRHNTTFPIKLETLTFSDVAVAVSLEPLDDKFPHLSMCDANQLRAGNPDLWSIGFPLDADRMRADFKIRNFSGPQSTWTIGGNIVGGFSGGPVMDDKNRVFGIVVGGQENLPGFNNMLPEYLFRSTVAPLGANYCDITEANKRDSIDDQPQYDKKSSASFEACSPKVFKTGNLLSIQCSDIPDSVLQYLDEQITSANLNAEEAQKQADLYVEKYFDLVDAYSKLAASLNETERVKSSDLILSGQLEAAESSLKTLQARIEAQKNNAKMEAAETMEQLLEAGLSAAGVVAKNLKWDDGAELRVCFMGGDVEAQKFVAETASQWTLYGNISFDFGYSLDGIPKACDEEHDYDIRVSLKTQPRNWSFVGKSALRAAKGEPTMSLFNTDKKTILHEFGHALGLHHTIFHPNSCANLINWDRANELFGQRYGWSETMVKRNLLPASGSSEVYTNLGFNELSIMQFPLPDEIFDSPEENCTSRPEKLSIFDKLALYLTYPM